MVAAEEVLQLDDCFLVHIDIESCPMAEIPLTDKLTWSHSQYSIIIVKSFVTPLSRCLKIPHGSTNRHAGFGIFQVRDGDTIISLRQAALQRLVIQSIANRATPLVSMQIPIMIRFF